MLFDLVDLVDWTWLTGLLNRDLLGPRVHPLYTRCTPLYTIPCLTLFSALFSHS